MFYVYYLYINIICKYLPGTYFEILHCFNVITWRQNLIKKKNIFIQTHVDFLLLKYDIISQ